MLLQNGKLRLDAPRFANVWELGQTVLGAHDIATESQAFPAGAPVRPRRLGLDPVEERQAQLLGLHEMPCRFLFRDIDQTAEPVIVLRPVHQANVARKAALGKVMVVEDATIAPGIESAAGTLAGVEYQAPFLQSHRVRGAPGEQGAGPWRPQLRQVFSPELIRLGLVDGVVLPRAVIDRKAAGESLLIRGLCCRGCMRLAGFFLRFGA